MSELTEEKKEEIRKISRRRAEAWGKLEAQLVINHLLLEEFKSSLEERCTEARKELFDASLDLEEAMNLRPGTVVSLVPTGEKRK